MDEDSKVSATATAASAGEALSSADAKARELLKEKYPGAVGAVGTVRWVSRPDGTHTATVVFAPADFPDGWDPDAALPTIPGKEAGKQEVLDHMLHIIGPILDAGGFLFAEDKLLFSKRVGDQLHCVHLGVHRRRYSLSTRLYLDEIGEFYREFEVDPRTYKQLSTLNQVFRDFDFPTEVEGEGGSVSQFSIEAADRDIVAFLTESVVPWFDSYSSLILVKNALEAQEHNSVRHESLLPIYYLLGDRAAVKKYLKRLLVDIKKTNQPKMEQFKSYYAVLRTKYPQFFPGLARLQKNQVINQGALKTALTIPTPGTFSNSNSLESIRKVSMAPLLTLDQIQHQLSLDKHQ